MSKIYRQGDCMLIEVPSIPKDCKRTEVKGPLVLLEGEATGHMHRFEYAHDVDMYVGGGARYVHVKAEAALTHEEHSTVNVPPGKYMVPVQVEYTPKELRRVQD